MPPEVEQQEAELVIQELRRRVEAFNFTGSLTPRTDRDFLLKFLRTKDFKIDPAFDSLRKYYANVHRNLNIITGIHPTQFISAFDSEFLVIFKNNFQGARTGVFTLRKWNPEEVNLRQLQLATVFLAEEYISQPKIQEQGFLVIFDLEGLRFEHVWKLSVKELRRIIKTGLEGLPTRVKGIHFLNPPPLFWSVYQIIQRFLKAKIRKRVHLHYSHESLHEHFDKQLLPVSLSGDLEDAEAVDSTVLEDLLERDMPYERRRPVDRLLERRKLEAVLKK